MLDIVFESKNIGLKLKLTIKGAIAIFLVVCALALPQLFHLLGGSSAGARFLPMYYPISIGSVLLGLKWGLGLAILSPLVSYLFTTYALGSSMPSIYLLPFMIFELCVFALIAGIFSKTSYKKWYVIPLSVLLATVLGRGLYLFSVFLLEDFTSLTFNSVLTQVYNSLLGAFILILVVSLITILIRLCIKKSNNE